MMLIVVGCFVKSNASRKHAHYTLRNLIKHSGIQRALPQYITREKKLCHTKLNANNNF